MSDKIKPCPFCGGTNIKPREGLEWSDVTCMDCRQCVSSFPCASERIWNTRPIEDSLQARIAEQDNELSALRTKLDELPAFLVKQDEADIFDEHNLNMLLIEYLLDIKPEKK